MKMCIRDSVVAGPGETVQIREGILYVNGKAVEDDTYDLIADAGIAEHEIKLGNDEYFVMGDNCNSSEDSRSGNIGPVSREMCIRDRGIRIFSVRKFKGC